MANLIIFPSSFFSINKVDEYLQQEYNAVVATGLFDIVLFDYSQWFNEETLVLNIITDKPATAVYRGWMMLPEKYDRFYASLLERNIKLVTNPDAYRLMHIFPNVYESFGKDTARMLLYPLHANIPINDIKNVFTCFMVKDYVKSVKGTEFPNFFDQSVTQAEFDKWMEVFYHYRGELLTGGICIKEYLNLKMYGNRTNEYRVFYINHIPATICRNSGQGNFTPEPPQDMVERYSKFESPYYTVDYAELSDGTWRVIEAGDGSVSGLSDSQDAEHYFRALYHCLK